MAASDMTMNIAGQSVAITCVQSGAMKIIGATMTAVVAIVAAM